MSVEKISPRQRIGIGFAITEVNVIAAMRRVSLVRDLFLCCRENLRESHQKKVGSNQMVPIPCRRLMAPLVAAFLFSLSGSLWAQGFPRGHGDPWGSRYETIPGGGHVLRREYIGLDAVRRWNEVVLNANALDHVPVAPEGPEQLGPLRTSRAFAIVHIAIFDAVNAIVGEYKSYTGRSPAHAGASMNAAIAQAAHDTLVELFPSQLMTFDALLAEDLSKIPNGRAKTDGIDLGRRAAAAILALRANDGSQYDEELYGDEYVPAVGSGK